MLPDIEEQTEGPVRHGFGSEGSLRDRMKARAEQMELHRTERFPVPGYAAVLEVELRTQNWEESRRIGDRHQRQRDQATRDLYVAADTIIETTVSFWEVDDAGHRERVDTSWVALAPPGGAGTAAADRPRHQPLERLGRMEPG
jgi:hypothetical protein